MGAVSGNADTQSGDQGFQRCKNKKQNRLGKFWGFAKSSPKVAWFMVFACSHLTILLLLIK
jgi:hypothetical protein